MFCYCPGVVAEETGMAVKHFVREQETRTVQEYTRRVYWLAGIYLGIVIAATCAIIIIIIQAKLFVTLSQRSNVETLTLAVILLLFAYLALISLPGAWGALKILYYNVPAWLGRDRAATEQRKHAALRRSPELGNAVYLNCVVQRPGQPWTPIRIPLQDAAGELGTIVIDGVKLFHEEGYQKVSNSIFAYFEQRIGQLVQQRDPKAEVQIVQWSTINDEPALQYASTVAFSRNLAKHLGSDQLWPTVELTDDDIETLKQEGSALCPALRNEAHLPDMEYSVEHTLPIIPEPLAFISLSRQEQRADPLASMGCAFIVTLVILALLVFFIWLPPWVPSK
jgi:hypothetical protein